MLIGSPPVDTGEHLASTPSRRELDHAREDEPNEFEHELTPDERILAEHREYERNTSLLAQRIEREFNEQLGYRAIGLEPEPVMLDRFVVLEKLGEGGMGSVYAAHDPKLDRRVAIKICRYVFEAIIDALATEARALAKLSHPNVVTVFEGLVVEGEFVLVMEFVAGQTLRKWAQTTSPGWREILDRFRDAGRGLAAVHAARLVHGDIKPDNLMIDHEGRVRVVDFGLAQYSRTPLDESDDVRGTPAYMPPEQVGPAHPHAQSGTRIDVFSFCVSIWELLFGTRPFDMIDILEEKQPAPKKKRTPLGLPRGIERVLLRGMAWDPRERWPSIVALCEALDAAAEEGTRRRARRRQAVGVISFAAMFVATLGLSAALLLEQPSREPPSHLGEPPPPAPVALANDAADTLDTTLALALVETRVGGSPTTAVQLLEAARTKALGDEDALRRVAAGAISVGDALVSQDREQARMAWQVARLCFQDLGARKQVEEIDARNSTLTQNR
jgi:predicted Ser/Thr protein kinase